jgi:hypothetical protein
MKRISRRITTRKTMRVATVFTGAAAAVALAPAAMAGTGHAAGTGNQARTDGKAITALRHGGRTTEIRPKTHGIVTSMSCRNAHWVHLEWFRSNRYCFGYSGYLPFHPALAVHHECGGTNIGVISLSNGNLSNFGPGTGYLASGQVGYRLMRRMIMSGQERTPGTGPVDEAVRRYRDEMDSEYQPLFDRLHQLIMTTCPDAEVVMSYGMPTYRLGRRRLNVGAWTHGLSLYVSPNRDGGFSARHPGLASGKGTIKLSPADAASIPDTELQDLIRAALLD